MNEMKLKKVFESIALSVEIEPITIKLPLAFSHRYELLSLSFLEEDLSFLLIKEQRSGSIESLIQQAEKISETAENPYILVFTEISAETRTLLLKARISFIDYKGNVFIPQLGMILKKFESKIAAIDGKFSPSEQAVMISLLLNHKKAINPTEIKRTIGVSIPTIYRALKRFEQNDWIDSEHGKHSLKKTPIEIYEECSKFFINPKKDSVFLDSYTRDRLTESKLGDTQMKLAGESALSQFSMLGNSDQIFAVSQKSFRDFRKSEGLSSKGILDKKIGQMAELELWEYAPIGLYEEKMVDPISLYLTTKDTNDPRIELELDQLKEYITECLEIE